jgi:outer membrane lipoprotein-sorting protein
MSNFLRRLPLSRLLLLCAVIVIVGVGATALATALSTGPTPPPKPLAEAVHDALSAAGGTPVQGVSARIQLTNHLVEGANLASGSSGAASQLSSSPLISGATGRLWIGADGRTRLELQSEKGDTQILYDGHTVSLYDASTNTLYRYTPPPGSGEDSQSSGAGHHPAPTLQEVQEGLSRLSRHANLSGATPTDVAGQPAYTVRISPNQNGGLIGGAELSWDANNGVPLRAAVYSKTSASAVIELTATEISYGSVASSVFDFTAPANAKVQEVTLPTKHGPSGSSASDGSRPKVATHGNGLAAITVVESQLKAGQKEASGPQLEGLPKVSINGTSATELPTALGTLLSFERSGVRYLLVGSVTPAAIEAFARGL